MIRPIILFTALCTYILGFSQQANVRWVATQGGIGQDFARSTYTDDQGNVFAVGYFTGKVDFDNSEDVAELTSTGGRDAFIAKYTSDGSLIWVKSISGSGHDMGEDIFVDDSGMLYFTGSFNSTVSHFDGNQVNLTSSGQDDVFILKLDSAGSMQWARSFGGSGVDEPEAIRVDVTGNVYNVGRFYSTADFDPGPSTHQITSHGNWDYYITKLSEGGELVWAQGLGSNGNDYILDIEIDNNGNLIMLGNFQGSMNFDPVGTADIRTSNGGRDIWVSKWDGNGNVLWTKTYGGQDDDWGRSLTLAGNGSIFCAGGIENSFVIEEQNSTHSVNSYGSRDGFIQKLNSVGETIWIRTIGGVDFDRIWGLDIDDSLNIFACGEFSSDGLGFNGESIKSNLNQGSTDIFLIKLNNQGNLKWIETAGSIGPEGARGVHVNHLTEIYLTGSYSMQADFSFGGNYVELNSNGLNDGFLLKISPCIYYKSYYLDVACDSYTWINGQTYTHTQNVSYLEPGLSCDTLHQLTLNIDWSTRFKDGYFFPNPSNGNLQLRESEQLLEIQIYNMLGQLIFESYEIIGNEINLDLAVGTYIAKFKTTCGSFKQTIVFID